MIKYTWRGIKRTNPATKSYPYIGRQKILELSIMILGNLVVENQELEGKISVPILKHVLSKITDNIAIFNLPRCPLESQPRTGHRC